MHGTMNIKYNSYFVKLNKINLYMCFAIWITKATDTHSKYMILLFHDNMKQLIVTFHNFVNAPKNYHLI